VLFDLPTGATIACTFGLVLILMARRGPWLAAARRHDRFMTDS
jgi:hypothetical protein